MWKFWGQGSNPSHISVCTESLTARPPGNSCTTFCLHLFAIVNNAATTMHVQVSQNTAFNSFVFIPQSRIAGSYNNYIFNFFEEPPPCLPQWLHHFTFLPARHLWHMEVPRLQVKSELQLLAYATATATRDPSCVCNLHHSSWQHRIPDPLGKARDQTLILMDASQIHFHWTTREHPGFQFADMLTNTYFILLYQQWTS